MKSGLPPATKRRGARGHRRQADCRPGADASGVFFAGGYGSLHEHPSEARGEAADSALITAAAAVAVAEALERLAGGRRKSSGSNDVFWDGKKVCGILTEGVVGADGRLESAVLGIGVNLAPPPGGFPERYKTSRGRCTRKRRRRMPGRASPRHTGGLLRLPES
jgi:hypothetical protein